MSYNFDNIHRTRYYGLRKGDTVSVEASVVGGIDILHAEVTDYAIMDNNRVFLKFDDGKIRPWVAEHCIIITKVEDKK